MNARVTDPAPNEVKPVTTPLAAAATAETKVSLAVPKKKTWRRYALMVAVPLLLAGIGGYFWLTGGQSVSTDNAYIHQATVAISADVPGRITSVAVHDNEVVKAGQVLFTIDPAPYKIALDQMDAALANARVGVEKLRVAYQSAQTSLVAAQNTLDLRQRELVRQQDLHTRGLASAAALDDASTAFQSATSAVSLAEQSVAGAVAALGGDPNIATDDHPLVRTALAAREAAARNLAKTIVHAPADGIVSQVDSLNVGQFIGTGTTIASLVETGNTWVEANFKETELSGLAAGMPADISIDAYPGMQFKGFVDSIGAATGSEFALIPAQNATGNWIKITQRIPVRIHLDPEKAAILRAGMSAVVTIALHPAAH